MWCDDCGRGICACLEESWVDQSNGWNDIWPPLPPAFKVERIIRKDEDFCFDRGEYYPWKIAKFFTDSETIRMEIGNQFFVRDSNNNWRSVIDHDA